MEQARGLIDIAGARRVMWGFEILCMYYDRRNREHKPGKRVVRSMILSNAWRCVSPTPSCRVKFMCLCATRKEDHTHDNI